MSYKKIDGIQPFNDLRLTSCYYNQLATVYSTFGVDPRIIAADSMPLYDFDKRKNILEIRHQELFNDQELLSLTGIEIQKIKNVNNLKKMVIDQINKNNFILTLVDAFYLAYNENYYHKIHSSHFILIYGYDTKARTFIVNEQMYFNSFRYEERIMPMSMVRKAYNQFKKKLMMGDYSAMVVSRKAEPQEDFRPLYRLKMKEFQNDLFKSTQNLIEYFQLIKSYIEDKKNFEIYSKQIIELLGAIKWHKINQKNILTYLWQNDDIDEILNKITNNYNFIYGNLSRMKLSGFYNAKYIVKVLERCNEIELLEYKLNEKLRDLNE